MSDIKEKKYAVMLAGKRITDYMYDDVIHTKNTLFGIQHVQKGASTIHAYSKNDGRVLFKKENVANYYGYDEIENCLFITLNDKRSYIYFDNLQKLKGPFTSVGTNHGLIIVKKIAKDKDGDKYEASGWIKALGKMVLPIKYNYIKVISNELVEAGCEGETILLDHRGHCIHPKTYTDFEYFGKLIRFRSKETGDYGVIDSAGRVILPCIYHYIDFDIERELIYITKDNLYGIYKNGKGIVFAPTFYTYCKVGEVVELIGVDDKTYGYIPKLDLLLPRRYYVYYENYLKYFDGYKWRKLKYDKK